TRIGGYASPPASTSPRLQVSVSPAVWQFQPSPPAFWIELNESAGNGSVTVTVEPSVGMLPPFVTDSVNVVGWPSIRPPAWVLLSVRLGAATVLIPCGDGPGN